VHIKTFQTGGDRNFAYLIADESSKEAVVIDPSYTPQTIVDYANEQGFQIAYVFCTHNHGDHTNGNANFEGATGVKALLFGDRDPKTGVEVAHDAVFSFGSHELRVLHTPGHTPDSLCFLVQDVLFTGDTLFVGKVGGTDLDRGARTEYASLHEILLTLPDETRVLPGHDVGVKPESTIGHEKQTNPFLLRDDVESFIDLKRNWAAYKEEHGIA